MAKVHTHQECWARGGKVGVIPPGAFFEPVIGQPVVGKHIGQPAVVIEAWCDWDKERTLNREMFNAVTQEMVGGLPWIVVRFEGEKFDRLMLANHFTPAPDCPF